MCIYIHIHIYIYVYVYIHICICLYTYIYTCMEANIDHVVHSWLSMSLTHREYMGTYTTVPHLRHSVGSTRLLSHSSLPHRCLSQTGESSTGRSNAALIGPHAVLLGPSPDTVVHLWLRMSLSHRGRHNRHERSANVDTSLLDLGIRAYRRELTSTTVR